MLEKWVTYSSENLEKWDSHEFIYKVNTQLLMNIDQEAWNITLYTGCKGSSPSLPRDPNSYPRPTASYRWNDHGQPQRLWTDPRGRTVRPDHILGNWVDGSSTRTPWHPPVPSFQGVFGIIFIPNPTRHSRVRNYRKSYYKSHTLG